MCRLVLSGGSFGQVVPWCIYNKNISMLKGEGIRESSGHYRLRKRYGRLRGSIGVSGWLGFTPISRYGIRRVGVS